MIMLIIFLIAIIYVVIIVSLIASRSMLVDASKNSKQNSDTSKREIIVPDDVEIDNSSIYSTQDIDCKKYKVSGFNNINVEVIKEEKIEDYNSNVDNQSIFSSNDDEEDNDPIKNL